MGTDIKPIISNPVDSMKAVDSAAQANQADQMRKTQEMQMAQMARKSMDDAIRNQNQDLHSHAVEFMGVIDSIAQEGFKLPKAAQGEGTGMHSQGGDTPPDFQRDLQILREMVREGNYLISQGMDVSQVVNKLKLEQGGQFWQNFQQMLQRQASTLKADFSQLGEQAIDVSKGVGEFGLTKEAAKSQEALKSAASQAILELLKAEANPQIQKEQCLSALQLLSKGNLTESSQKLLSYLRKRGNFSDQELNYFYSKQEPRKDIFQNPFPLPQEKIKRSSFWYMLCGLAAFGISFGLGFNLAGSITVGVTIIVLMFIFSFISKK